MSCYRLPRRYRCRLCEDSGITAEYDEMVGWYYAFCACAEGRRSERLEYEIYLDPGDSIPLS